jgi:hypothetical protein
MQYLNNKKILFIAPKFFGYENDIKKELESQGAFVDWMPDRPFESALLKALTKYFPEIISILANNFYLKLINKFGNKNYDYVFVINGQTLSGKTMTHIKSKSPGAIFILYLWDSISNRSHIKNKIHYFTRKFTFDSVDAVQYGIQLRPLFYGHGFDSQVTESIHYKISFVGTIHTDRFNIINKIRKNIPDGAKTFWYLYLQASWVFWLYRYTNQITKDARIDDFKFSSLAKNELQKIFSSSLAILDIEHSSQNGLTMRTLETLGAQKKLITTNKNIQQYDFYNSENICIINRHDPIVPVDFLIQPYRQVSEMIRSRYSITGWIHEIFNEEYPLKSTL